MNDLSKSVKDAAYVTVGLGVIAFQRGQVRRRELQKQLSEQLTGTREQVQRLAQDLEQRFEPVIEQFEDRLPEQGRDLVKQARGAAKEAQDRLLHL